MEAKVVDGELWVKGPNVTPGYWKRPEADRETFTADGYMRTGDIVTVDEDGHIRVTDRLKELIKVRGFQVAPAELEGVLLSRDDVVEAGVVPVTVPEQATELPRAYGQPLLLKVGTLHDTHTRDLALCSCAEESG